jgi:hypothetical protein
MDKGKRIKLFRITASTGIRKQYFGTQTCHPFGVQVNQRDSLTQMKIRQAVIINFRKNVF